MTGSNSGGGPTPSGPPPGNTGGGNTGGGSGPSGPGGSGGGGSSGGGSNGPIPNEQYDDGSGNGYGGYSSGNSTNAPASITNIDFSQLTPCVAQIVQDIQTMAQNNVLSEPIARLLNTVSLNPNIRVKFVQVPTLLSPTQKDVNGNPLPDRAQIIMTRPNEYTITLNSSFLSGTTQATDLAVAADIIHEMLHVYMSDWASTHNISTGAELEFIMNAYFDLANYGPNSTNGIDHETMGSMTSYMGSALLNYYNSTITSRARIPNISNPINKTYCEYLAWGTLRTTSFFRNKQTTNPAWGNQVLAASEAERHPDAAGGGQTIGSGSTSAQILAPTGKQNCP